MSWFAEWRFAEWRFARRFAGRRFAGRFTGRRLAGRPLDGVARLLLTALLERGLGLRLTSRLGALTLALPGTAGLSSRARPAWRRTKCPEKSVCRASKLYDDRSIVWTLTPSSNTASDGVRCRIQSMRTSGYSVTPPVVALRKRLTCGSALSVHAGQEVTTPVFLADAEAHERAIIRRARMAIAAA